VQVDFLEQVAACVGIRLISFCEANQRRGESVRSLLIQ
jgi:hypothetical protein